MSSTEQRDLEVALGEARAELVTTKRDLEEMTARCELADKKVAEMSKNMQGYIDEFKRAALEAQKIVTQLGNQLSAGDALRNRLAKVTDALAKADALILAIDSKSGNLEEHRAAYAQCKLELSTPDNVTHAGQQAPAER